MIEALAAALFGLLIGSFLNVCIYRMPRDLAVNNPPRSFCPSCKYQIPWWNNLPLFSWLLLRGRCANCKSPIAFRYFGVELLTGLLFLAVWRREGSAEWILLLPLWLLVSLFVVATFIDFEHFIIPDEITWGGAAAGVVLSFAIPTLHGTESHFMGAVWSLVGAAAGFLLLWAVVELGKKAFGKKSFDLHEPTAFSWIRKAVQTPEGEMQDADLVVGDTAWQQLPPPSFPERVRALLASALRALRLSRSRPPARGEAWVWSETFYRDSDRLRMHCDEVEIDGERFRDATLIFNVEELSIGERKWALDKVVAIRGTARSVIIPREAMGFGDVKFLAAIGAFLGWKAVLFTVMSASLVGALVGILGIVLGRREWSAKIPFGPYLALGALVWMFAGPELVSWYWNFAISPPPPQVP